VSAAKDERPVARRRRSRPSRRVLPGWLLDLHELDLRELCHKCVRNLPEKLGHAEIALYLYNAERNVLTLAETNSKRTVELAVPVVPNSRHVLSVVARSGRPLVTPDLLEACRTADLRCPTYLERDEDRAAVVAPLMSRRKLHGVLLLNGHRRTARSEVGLELEPIFAFLGRCLQHARQHLRARIQARVDRLTGLFNYRWMVEALGKEMRRAQRYDSPVTLIMIDLDGLKTINDRWGHLAGDALLRHTAGKIGSALRQIDSAARIGGDEFVVLLPSTGLAGARHVAERILAAIRTDAPLIGRRPLPVAASLGVAQWQEGWDVRRWLQAADKAMYAAKREGRNQLVCLPQEAPAKQAAAAEVPAPT
jgi:diguanylate cyclase (GGDEF)-like protein